jgi:nucleoside-diphosphate-sugar epimerase
MNFFITGASGFIGKNLINVLKKNKKNKIFSLSRSKKNYNYNNSNIWVVGSLKSNFRKYLTKTDVVIHLATEFDYGPQFKIYQTNLVESLKFFENARKYGVKKYIVAGSGFEHGNSKRKITTLSLMRPISDYQISKALFNIKVCNWAKKYKLNLTYLKIFHVYGAKEKKKRLYPQVVIAAKKNKQISISKYSNSIIRDFINVKDVVKDIIEQLEKNKGVNLVNSCSGNKKSLFEFSKLVWRNNSNKKCKVIANLPIKPNPMSNFGIRGSTNIDKIAYNFKKIKLS